MVHQLTEDNACDRNYSDVDQCNKSDAGGYIQKVSLEYPDQTGYVGIVIQLNLVMAMAVRSRRRVTEDDGCGKA